MNVLVLGLYAEGRTDERFLPTVIQRTSELILMRHDHADIEALEPFLIKKKHASVFNRAECILQAARDAYGYHALVVHSDADHPTSERARSERFDPGYELVQRANEEVCKHLIPIIPVRMVEAWMLADPEALRNVMRTMLHAHRLGLPTKAKLVESDKDPKETMKCVIQEAYPNQPHQWNRMKGILYADLAPMISLERLEQVPAYQQFVKDLTSILKALNFIH